MKNTPTITMPKKEAEAAYKDYLEAVKTRKEKYVEELKQVYYHLSKGAKVLDVYEAFKQSGVNEQGEPNLGISVSSRKSVFFHKQSLGAGFFSDSDFQWGSHKDNVILPSFTFSDWETALGTENWNKGEQVIQRRRIKTNVPLVPAHLLPKGSLDGYYILWEVSGWNEVPEMQDPFLLKRINANAFVVLAEWDVTPMEQAIMRGR